MGRDRVTVRQVLAFHIVEGIEKDIVSVECIGFQSKIKTVMEVKVDYNLSLRVPQSISYCNT